MNVRTDSEYQKAINYIIEMIKDGKLIVGSKIPSERDLAETLGIGRNSTREALSILRGMGLVESIHGSGNYISEDSGRSIKTIVSVMLALGTITKKDLIEVRQQIDYAVKQILLKKGIGKESGDALRQIIESMKTASPEEFNELDKDFHIGLIRATGNFLLITILEPVGELYGDVIKEINGLVDESDRDTVAELHANILRSLENKDLEACDKYLFEHYNTGKQISGFRLKYDI